MEWIDIFTMKVYRVLLIQIKYLTTYRRRHSLRTAGGNEIENIWDEFKNSKTCEKSCL